MTNIALDHKGRILKRALRFSTSLTVHNLHGLQLSHLNECLLQFLGSIKEPAEGRGVKQSISFL